MLWNTLLKMAVADHLFRDFILIILVAIITKCEANDILGCGGFVKSHVPLDFARVEIGLYTKAGSLKERTECAPTNGYYFLPLYEKGEYVLKVHPPPGWSFEPSQVELNIDGTSDQCSSNQDINFSFNGFGITGKVITAGQTQGPSGIKVQLVNENGERRDTLTSVGGDFHFTPVIPGKYTLKASHPRWKLDPASAIVQVKEGNTALPIGVLAVKGYDVKGSVISYGNPIGGVYVLLYPKEENPKLRVEGCKTSLLQGVPDAPICHSVTDAKGEFSFDLVPAGEYKLLALAQTPGQAALRYNIKPESVPFTVAHDSLYIKNAFEVLGFTILGSVLTSAGGKGVSGVQVLLDNKPAGNTDQAGRFTLPSLQPATYTLSFRHEQCEIVDVTLTVTAQGPVEVPTAKCARWRVCGAVSPATPRRDVALSGGVASVTPTEEGKWCTFLAPGVYFAKVEVTEAEQREGLQFYPLNQKITVANAPVDGVVFSQLKAKLTGAVQCKTEAACENLLVTLRPLSPDGGYVGQPLITKVINGQYTFEDVLPGSVEVSVPADRLCWAEARYNTAVTTEEASVPAFEHTGYVLKLHSSHDIEVEYSSALTRGVLTVPAGLSQQCVSTAERYTLTPRGQHRFEPATVTADTTHEPRTIHFVAIAHAVVIKVLSPEAVNDLVLRISSDSHGMKDVGPLVPLEQPGGGYAYEHTLFMADGEVAVVSASSPSLLFHPMGPVQVMGRSTHQPRGLTLRAHRGLTLGGRLEPPVGGATVTLTTPGGDLKLTQTTTEDGKYSFGPLDATKHYTITVEKESYVFGERQEDGVITAHKLAEIIVTLADEAGKPLQGALVSVSGGSYRRNAVSGPDGELRFPSLSPAQYYVKPAMKEYRFLPPHTIVHAKEGATHRTAHEGKRVAWSCFGKLVSLAGVGWPRATVLAVPLSQSPPTAMEEATTEAGGDGSFRIRGLLPNIVYSLQLKESNAPETRGLKLAKAPPTIEVKDNKDIENILLIAIQPTQITDVNVLVYTPNIEHYKTLRLSLALENTPHTPIYSNKLDAAGYNQFLNPGLMYALPRLPADNKTYILQLESTLSKSTHSYGEEVHYFTSDGKFKSFNIHFLPKVKSSEQELRQTSLLVIPLLALLALAYHHRVKILQQAGTLAAQALKQPSPATRGDRQNRQELLDKSSIEHILSTVNAAGKRVSKKKQ